MNKISTNIACAITTILCSLGNANAIGECVPGAEEIVDACSRLSTIGSWEGPRANSATCNFNAPAGWIIIDHQVIERSSNNGSTEVSTVAAGSNFMSEADLRQVYASLNAISGEYGSKESGKSEFAGQLENKFNWHLREIRKFQSSHNMLQAIVRASAHGNELFDRKRGWQDVDVKVRLRCLGA